MIFVTKKFNELTTHELYDIIQLRSEVFVVEQDCVYQDLDNKDKLAVTELFKEISVKIGDRPGGYIRIIKLGNRQGDNAPMAMVELVDYNEIYNPKGKKAKKSTRRGRRKKTEQVTTPVEAPAASEEEKSEA